MTKAEELYEKIAGYRDYSAAISEERAANTRNNAQNVREKGMGAGVWQSVKDEFGRPHMLLPVTTKRVEANTEYYKKLVEKKSKANSGKAPADAGFEANALLYEVDAANIREHGVIKGSLKTMKQGFSAPNKVLMLKPEEQQANLDYMKKLLAEHKKKKKQK